MGTSKNCIYTCYDCKDHPHAYGDKVMILLLTVLALGSSPRVWGQEAPLLVCNDNIRIIPTRMGTSLLFCVEVFNLEDHPHAYGDKVFQVFLSSPKEGSSPRVWGQVYFWAIAVNINTIIPTRMGTSSSEMYGYGSLEDHPHAYGDKNQVQRNGLQYIGSSPRVWGQVFKTISKRSNSRIIPTRMGTSV